MVAAPSVRRSPKLQTINEDEEDFSIHSVHPEERVNAKQEPRKKRLRKLREAKNEAVKKNSTRGT